MACKMSYNKLRGKYIMAVCSGVMDKYLDAKRHPYGATYFVN